MLYAGLFFSFLLTLLALLPLRFSTVGMRIFVVSGLFLSGFTIYFGAILPPVILHFFLLFVALEIAKKRPRLYPILILGVAVGAYGFTTLYGLGDQLEMARLRKEYPYESMEDRLPSPPAERGPHELSPDGEARFFDQEILLSNSSQKRIQMLENLHEEKVERFINGPGFGISRMRYATPSRKGLELEPVELWQQPSPTPLTGSSLEAEPWTRRPVDDDLFKLHGAGVLDFVNPRGFGYFKDRQHVAGFQSHLMRKMPLTDTRSVDSIDLVGLLLHEKPVAYVSDELPRMDKLRQAPTRPLNDFETAGLAKLRKAEDLIVESSSTKMRMLGSIRSTKQCLECHGGQRGDLLGAFSYTLK